MRFLPLVIFLCLVTYSYGQDQKQPINAKIKNYELSLHKKQDGCYLSYNGSTEGTLKLDIPAPCHFSSYRSGEVQKFNNPDIGEAAVVAVIGNILDRSCKIQGILIRKNEIEKSGCFCDDRNTACGPLDEKVFWLLSH